MPEQLAAALASALGEPVEINDLTRLTGGASRETWAFTANGLELILRRDPPNRPSELGMRDEAEVMRACLKAGLRVPDVLMHDAGDLLGSPGLVMLRVPGETIPRRILRDDAYAAARPVLVEELGRFLAGLHALDPADVPSAQVKDPLSYYWSLYQRVGASSAVFERTQAWLLENRPPDAARVLVHGDLRLGNVIVSGRGLQAVIDWELMHLGDPLEDLAWLCVKAWRFGARLEVGGLGTLDDLVAAYEAAGGATVDRAALHWWLVQKTLQWGIGCMAQADVHLSGAVRSVELAAIGRRVAEQEWDLIELLDPDACSAAVAAPAATALPDDVAPYGRPTARELITAVREFLVEDVMAKAEGGVAFRARVAVNVLGILERELALPPVARVGDDWATLALAVRDRLATNNPAHLAMT